MCHLIPGSETKEIGGMQMLLGASNLRHLITSWMLVKVWAPAEVCRYSAVEPAWRVGCGVQATAPCWAAADQHKLLALTAAAALACNGHSRLRGGTRPHPLGLVAAAAQHWHQSRALLATPSVLPALCIRPDPSIGTATLKGPHARHTQAHAPRRMSAWRFDVGAQSHRQPWTR